MTVNEAWATAQELLRSMSMEERTAYAFCFQTSRSHQFFFALLRQPSFFNAEGLEKLLEEWTNIENSSEYKETIEERKRRTELQTQPKAELQNLRMERESAPTFDGPSQRNPDPGYPAQLSGRQEVATPPDALCLSHACIAFRQHVVDLMLEYAQFDQERRFYHNRAVAIANGSLPEDKEIPFYAACLNGCIEVIPLGYADYQGTSVT